jgi:hypothetical protein
LNVKYILGVYLFCSLSTSYAWSLFSPKDYDECILQNMKGVTDQTAATAVIMSCSNKFSSNTSKGCQMREMTKAELSEVSANADVSSYGNPYFSGSFYNGNSVATIDEIYVVLSAENIRPPQEYKLFLQYPVNIKSAGTAGITVQKIPTKNFSWSIKSIKTCSK